MVKKQHDFDKLTDKLTDSILTSIDSAPKSDVPFGAVELSKEEQIQNYLAMRDDVQKWQELFAQHGIKDVMRYARDMEKAIHEPAEVDDAISTDNEG